MKKILRFLYCEEINIQKENCLSILEASDELGIDELQEHCINEILKLINENNGCKEFENSRLRSIQLSNSIKKLIEADTIDYLEKGIQFLSKESLIEILKSNIEISEDDLFNLVWKIWIPSQLNLTKKNNNDQENKKELMKELTPYIRFELMTADFLTDIIEPLEILDMNTLYNTLKSISNTKLSSKIKPRESSMFSKKSKQKKKKIINTFI